MPLLSVSFPWCAGHHISTARQKVSGKIHFSVKCVRWEWFSWQLDSCVCGHSESIIRHRRLCWDNASTQVLVLLPLSAHPQAKTHARKNDVTQKMAHNHWHKFEQLRCLSARECPLSPQFRFIEVMNGRRAEDERVQTSNKENESQISAFTMGHVPHVIIPCAIGHGNNNRKTLKLHTNNTKFTVTMPYGGPDARKHTAPRSTKIKNEWQWINNWRDV